MKPPPRVAPRVGYLQGYRVHPKLALRAWQREVTLYKRIWPSTILSTLLDPVMYLLALGFGLGAYVGNIQGRPYLEFIAPGLVASSVMYAAVFEAAWHLYAAEHSRGSITARRAPLLQCLKHCNFQEPWRVFYTRPRWFWASQSGAAA